MGRSDSAGKTVSRQATRPAKASVKAVVKPAAAKAGSKAAPKKAASKPAAAPAKAKSAKAPRLRDVHEYLLVFTKGGFSRQDRGESDISGEEFMESTLSIWQVKPESARKVGHPAPFPVELAARVLKLYSYVGDVVLDPFVGSGTTCVAAKLHDRHYVGFDISPEYCALANKRLQAAGG